MSSLISDLAKDTVASVTASLITLDGYYILAAQNAALQEALDIAQQQLARSQELLAKVKAIYMPVRPELAKEEPAKVLLTNDLAGPLPQPVDLPYGVLGDKDIEAIEEEARASVQGKRDDEDEANAKARGDTYSKLLGVIVTLGLGLVCRGGGHV